MTPFQLRRAESREGLLTVFYFEWLRHQHKHVPFHVWILKPKLTKEQRAELKAFDRHTKAIARAEAELEAA